MTVSKTWNGTGFNLPEAGDTGWADLTAFLSALAGYAQTTNAQKFGIRRSTALTTTVVAATDCVIISAPSTAGARAVTLPAGVAGQVFIIADGNGDSQTNQITISGTGGQTFVGAATYVLAQSYGFAGFVFDGAQWQLISTGSASGAVSGSTGFFTGTTDATSVSTGAVIIAGGVGIAKSLFVGGNVNLVGATASRAAAFDASKNIQAATTTLTELNYLSGVTSAVQTQLNGKQATITNLPASLGGTGLTVYTIGDIGYASGTTALSKLGIGTTGTFMKSTGSAPSWASITQSDVSGLGTALSGKQATLTTGTTAQYFKGDLSLGTFASDVTSAMSGTSPSFANLTTTGTTTLGTANSTSTLTVNGATILLSSGTTAGQLTQRAVSSGATGYVSLQSRNSTDTGTQAMMEFYVDANSAAAIATRPLYTWNNFGTNVGIVSAAGVWTLPAGVAGRTSGTAIPAGIIGQTTITGHSGTTVTTVGGTAVDLDSFSLAAGVWRIDAHYDLNLASTTSLGLNSGVTGALLLTDNANSVLAQAACSFQQVQSATAEFYTYHCSVTYFVNISSTLTYKTRAICNQGTAGGSVTVYSNGATLSNGVTVGAYYVAQRIA